MYNRAANPTFLFRESSRTAVVATTVATFPIQNATTSNPAAVADDDAPRSDGEEQSATPEEEGPAGVSDPTNARTEEAPTFASSSGGMNERTTNPLKPLSFYTTTRTDRSGSAVLDMLFALAYAFRNNLTYSGACSRGSARSQMREPTHRAFLRVLGLEGVLAFSCPPKSTNETTMTPPAHIVLEPQVYRQGGLFTAPFLAYLRPLRRRPAGAALSSDAKVVAHVRRGDVGPCTRGGRSWDRYTPNKLFLDVIRTLPYSPDEITVFSQSSGRSSSGAESFQDFAPYHMEIDGPPTRVWEAIADAEVVVLSKSAFSYVPAIFNTHTVLYTPFWHHPLQGWQKVDKNILSNATLELKRLQSEAGCKSHRRQTGSPRGSGGSGGNNSDSNGVAGWH